MKLIEVAPGKRLSLQRHALREEHWIVVSGCGTAEVGGAAIELSPGTSVRVGCHETHRLAASEDGPLLILEFQKGECREDDIERLEDDFGRA